MYDTSKLFDDLSAKALETNFWRAEYIKRKAYKDSPEKWEVIKEDLSKFVDFLHNSKTETGENIDLPEHVWMNMIFSCYLPYILDNRVENRKWTQYSSYKGMNYFGSFSKSAGNVANSR